MPFVRALPALLLFTLGCAQVAPSAAMPAPSFEEPVAVRAGETAEHLAAIRAPEAWKITRGRPEVTIAVVDGALSIDHPALAGKLLAGRNVFTGDAAISPGKLTQFHATFSAGLIAGEGLGVQGVAPGCRVLPVQVRDAHGKGTAESVAEGIEFATAQRAKVIVVYGGKALHGSHAPSARLARAVAAAQAADALVVATAGSDNRRISAEDEPVACLPGVVVVSGTRGADARYERSNWGPQVTLAAPGQGIRSSFPGVLGIGRTWTLSCASWGAALTAGVAGLVRSAHPEWTAAQVARRLETSARDAGPAGHDPQFGHGVLDAYEAVR